MAREDTEALDGGITVNPDLVCAQIKGGFIWALGAVDVFTVPTAFSILESIRLDLGYRMDVHP